MRCCGKEMYDNVDNYHCHFWLIPLTLNIWEPNLVAQYGVYLQKTILFRRGVIVVNSHYIPQFILRHFCVDNNIQYCDIERQRAWLFNLSINKEYGCYDSERFFKLCMAGSPYNIIFTEDAPTLSQVLGFGSARTIIPLFQRISMEKVPNIYVRYNGFQSKMLYFWTHYYYQM